MDEQNIKRLFLGMNAEAPWPEKWPEGRVIEEPHRHFTFAFIGDEDANRLLALMPRCPKPPFKVGLAGFFDACLLFPPRHPHVVAWRGAFGPKQQALIEYQKEVEIWLAVEDVSFRESQREFVPHATVCRQPFDAKKWQNAFQGLPVISSSLHLFESLGYSKYQSLWNYALPLPFTELPHTADLAFLIRGESLEELHWNASMALCYHHPELLKYCRVVEKINDLNAIIIDLNNLIGVADSECGSPYKAVSFHGDLIKNELLEWEMIIDV